MRSATKGDRFGVYCYLRLDGSPYYIGRMASDYRAFSKDHEIGVPPQAWRIRLMRGNLSREQANWWERFYIARYGRYGIDEGGILRQTRIGGDGGDFPDPEVADRLGLPYEFYKKLDVRQKKAMRKWLNNNPKSSAKDWFEMLEIENYRSKAAKEGAEERESRVAARYGTTFDRYKSFSLNERAMIAHRYKLGIRGEDLFMPANSAITKSQYKAAEKYGISIDRFLALSKKEKDLAKARYRKGTRGEALFASANSELLEATLQAAQKYCIAPMKWMALTAKQRACISGRYFRGLRGSELLAGIAA